MSENRFVKALNMTKSFDGVTVIDDLSFEFDEPGIYLVQGDSGKGKTTLLRILAGLDKCDSGEVTVNGKTGVVFQEPRLFDNVSLLENVKLVSDGTSAGDPMALLSAVGLGDDAGKTAAESSGGMCQRAAICRALYYGPDVLLCDEPFSAIDDNNTRLAAALLEQFALTGICIVATHGGDVPFDHVKAILTL